MSFLLQIVRRALEPPALRPRLAGRFEPGLAEVIERVYIEPPRAPRAAGAHASPPAARMRDTPRAPLVSRPTVDPPEPPASPPPPVPPALPELRVESTAPLATPAAVPEVRRISTRLEAASPPEPALAQDRTLSAEPESAAPPAEYAPAPPLSAPERRLRIEQLTRLETVIDLPAQPAAAAPPTPLPAVRVESPAHAEPAHLEPAATQVEVTIGVIEVRAAAPAAQPTAPAPAAAPLPTPVALEEHLRRRHGVAS